MPGHLFSYWDGCGKAWPTCFVSGKLDKRGCYTERHLFNGPRTRQVYVSENKLILKGCLKEEIPLLKGEWSQNPVSFWFDLESQLTNHDPIQLIQMILEKFSSDVFVTPVRERKRIIRYASDLLVEDSEFQQFLKYCGVELS